MTEDWTEANAALETFRGKVDSLVLGDLQTAAGVAADQPTIYHYTDVKDFVGILKTGSLWFTERAHLNDPVEIQYGLDIAHELFTAAAERRGPYIPQAVASHLKGEHDYGLATYGFWICSFSLNSDDLAQWRNYADDGRGISLGFSVQNFDMVELAKLLPNEPKDSSENNRIDLWTH
jgi:hypothetical protein